MSETVDIPDGSVADDVGDFGNGAGREDATGAARCWVVSNGRAGTQNQALGLARALESRLALSVHIKLVALNKLWVPRPANMGGDPFRRLSQRGHLLRPPFPDLWIAAGNDTVPLTVAVKRHAPDVFTIQTQNPRVAPDQFDLVIPPAHDRLEGDNVLSMIGAPTPLTTKKIASARAAHADWFDGVPTPQIAVLLGGANKYKYLTPTLLDGLIANLKALAADGYGIFITSSRRTNPAHLVILRDGLRSDIEAGRIKLFEAADADVTGFNPYPGMLFEAAAILVTEDSVNMISEAAITGTPVYTIPLEGRYGKFGHFHKDMRRHGVTRRFEGAIEDWSYEPINETARVANEIADRLSSTGRFRAIAED